MNIDIASLLERPKGETIDFKATSYALSDKRKKRDFAKDIACFANTRREGDAHIVLGVKKKHDGSFELLGIANELDDAYLQAIASSRYGVSGRVFINRDQYFEGVESEIWDFTIGGYRPAEKWLKDRKGRVLSDDDIDPYRTDPRGAC